ncbi:zf-HC2 domain-containing protein [Methylobacterium sp. C1]|uniref:zf-HC2 domain-containing protein n=1 Tax=Methylobacterium sp. C1 TaxID=1479019 RepID=UPI0009F332ED|nr:zf-HC2 domain-containing protein [Methylobacterium sp. C1]
MRCREAAGQAGGFVDAEVPGRMRWRIRLHLAICGDCRRFVEQIAHTRDTLGRLSPPPLDPACEDAIVAAVRAASR